MLPHFSLQGLFFMVAAWHFGMDFCPVVASKRQRAPAAAPQPEPEAGQEPTLKQLGVDEDLVKLGGAKNQLERAALTY
eukprot:2315892-Karenia_brevis.AAC.1